MSTQEPAQPEQQGQPGQYEQPGQHGRQGQEPRHDTTSSLRPVAADASTSELSSATEETPPAPALSVEEQEAVGSLPPDSALLVVQRGPNTGARFLLDAERTTAGRHPDSDIFLDDVTVSRRHAEFLRTAEGFRVRDAGSLNGTYVNRDRVDEVALSPDDEVQVGKYRMTFHPRTSAGPTS